MVSEREHPSIEILGQIAGVEIIAVGGKIREIERLRKVYGHRRWRKMKGIAVVRLPDGTTSPAPRYTGTKVTASAGRKSRSSACSAKCDEKTKVHEELPPLRQK